MKILKPKKSQICHLIIAITYNVANVSVMRFNQFILILNLLNPIIIVVTIIQLMNIHFIRFNYRIPKFCCLT